jgi:hypothetical protein
VRERERGTTAAYDFKLWVVPQKTYEAKAVKEPNCSITV